MIPPFLQTMIDSPPAAGSGVHAWLFRVSRQLHAHLPAGEIVRLLEARVAQCGRHVSKREIAAAVTDALRCAWQRQCAVTQGDRISKWPAVDAAKVQSISGGPGLADLWESSPVRIGDNSSNTEPIIDSLFPNDPLLCCGQTNSVFDTKPRGEWRGQLSKLQLIVPSPMSAKTGMTKEGRESAHSLANTGPRRFLVIEFDSGTADSHAALLLHLAQYAPLVLAVHSGKKSLHGWFFCAGQSEEKLLRFMRYAARIGADRATWTRSQFVRMPDGMRDNGQRQTIFYFNPRPIR